MRSPSRLGRERKERKEKERVSGHETFGTGNGEASFSVGSS